MAEKKASSAANPPAEAPMPTMGKPTLALAVGDVDASLLLGGVNAAAEALTTGGVAAALTLALAFTGFLILMVLAPWVKKACPHFDALECSQPRPAAVNLFDCAMTGAAVRQIRTGL